MAPSPSGEQFEIAYGDQRATIVEVGGGLREYVHGEREVLQPYPLDAICDGAHGAPLIPWPNRLADGRYSFDGGDYRLALSEPEKQNAIHGLLRWRSWRALERSQERVVVGIRLYPLTGWPFPLDVSIAYSLGEDGLTVATRATNLGDGTCPFASGQHPYLSPGADQTVDPCTLELRAATRILTDGERQLPTGTEPVAGTDYDFSSPRRLESFAVDDAYTDLERDGEGLAWVRLGCPDDRTVEMWVDKTYPVVQVYTADTLEPDRQRRAMAAEPMTAPPNALQTGQMLLRLDPGEEHISRWGVRLR